MIFAIRKRLLALNVKQSFWTLADQCVVSFGSFITNILLARSLPPAEYGVYVLILGILFFLNTLHGSLLTYPLLVKGAATDKTGLGRLATGSLLLTAVLVLPLSVGVLGVASAVGKPWLAPWVVGALLLWQVQETTRRALMAHLRYREALWGDMLSYLGQGSCVWILSQSGQLSFEGVFGIMALTSGIAGAIQAFQLGLKSISLNKVYVFAKSFWGLGHWMLLSNLANFFTNQATPWILAFFHGMEQAAGLQAIINLLGISHPLMFGIANLIVPTVAKVSRERGVGAARRAALSYVTQGGFLLLPYYVTLLFWPRGALSLFYGSESPYLELEIVVRLMVLSYIFWYASITLGAFLNGLEKSRLTFITQFVSTLFALTIGLPLAAWGGLVGASGGIVLAALAGFVTNVTFIQKLR